MAKEKEYKAMIQYELTITATNKDTAEYLAQQSIPRHINNTTGGKSGSGSAKFLSCAVILVTMES